MKIKFVPGGRYGGSVYEAQTELVTVGRDSSCDICLADEFLPRGIVALTIGKRAGAWYIDPNVPTLLNGKDLRSKKAKLANGDRIVVGVQAMTIEIEEDKEEAKR